MFRTNKRAGILGGRKTHKFLHFCNLIGFCLHTFHTLQQCLLYFDNNWQQSIKQAWFPKYVVLQFLNSSGVLHFTLDNQSTHLWDRLCLDNVQLAVPDVAVHEVVVHQSLRLLGRLLLHLCICWRFPLKKASGSFVGLVASAGFLLERRNKSVRHSPKVILVS